MGRRVERVTLGQASPAQRKRLNAAARARGYPGAVDLVVSEMEREAATVYITPPGGKRRWFPLELWTRVEELLQVEAPGRWKRGGKRRPLVVTKGLQETRNRVAEAQRHVADARREAYHLGANRLLSEFSTVGVGNWRGRGKAPGVGRAKRAQNRKDYDNAISEFTSILKDKAARCIQPRTVLDIREAGTTKNCPDCGEPTGPSGLKDLKVRAWTCPACGANHQRDFASARAIAARTLAQAAAGTLPAQPEAKASNSAVALTKVRVRKRRAKSPLLRKKASESERRRGVSAGKPVGVEVPLKAAPCSQPPIHREMELPLANPDALIEPTRRDMPSARLGK